MQRELQNCAGTSATPPRAAGQLRKHCGARSSRTCLQHCRPAALVDSGDPRAHIAARPDGLLRGSAELLAASACRWPRRWPWSATGHAGPPGSGCAADDIAPELAALPLPPGLLLTLVENAVEHGIAPALHRGRS
jgi:hypothetical protein